jgi:hypothetical protein
VELAAGTALFVWMGCGVAQARGKKPVILIHPGKGVGRLLLGDGPAQFDAVFPNTPGGVNNTVGGSGADCPAEMYLWYDKADNSSAVNAYTASTSYSFVLITVYGPLFRLPNGMFALDPSYWGVGPAVGTTMRQVERAFPDGHLYVRTNTDSDWNFDHNLEYWVDRKVGIAFALVWWPPQKQRIVQKISVFVPGANFKPDGCISPPDQYRKIR